MNDTRSIDFRSELYRVNQKHCRKTLSLTVFKVERPLLVTQVLVYRFIYCFGPVTVSVGLRSSPVGRRLRLRLGRLLWRQP